jgi:predicted dehydrogenase
MRPYRVGILGFGFIGKVHSYGYRNLPLFYDPLPLAARITHVCTSRPETAEAGARLVGAEHAVTDFRAVTENPEVDIVHICTPNDRHKEALLSAMAHDKHIYCDKPLVADEEEAAEVREALGAYRGVAQMTLQNRFFPPVLRARRLIDEGFLGQPLEYRCAYLHAGSADPEAPLKWKLSGAAGGGVIADLASHAMDLVNHLLGDYRRLLAATRIAYPERPAAGEPQRRVPVDAEDCVMLLAEMADGCLGHLEATKIATGAEDEMRLEIHGEKGALRFNGMDPHHLEIYDRTAPDQPVGGTRGWTRVDTGQRYPAPAAKFPGPKFAIGWLRGHMACLANFLQSVAEERPAEPGLEQGLYIQHLIGACRRAAARGAWETVEPRPEAPTPGA